MFVPVPSSNAAMSGRTGSWLLLGICMATLIVGLPVGLVAAASGCPVQANQAEPADGQSRSRQAWLVRIQLPIGHQTVQQTKLVLGNLAQRAPVVIRPDERPVVILEFATDRGQNGSGSQLADCMELAQLLSGEEMNRLQTVAWIPSPRGGVPASLPGQATALPPGLYGHAVLVAICADSVALDRGMVIGRADLDLPRRDPLAIDIYRNLAGQRLTVPAPVALSMIDPNESLFSVKTSDGELLAGGERMEELETAGKVIESTTLAEAGRTASYDGAGLQRLAPGSRSAAGLAGLAARLRVDLSRIESETGSDRKLIGLRQELNGYIDSQTAEWVIRAIDSRTRKEGSANLLILSINSPGGDVEACLKLARYISGFDSDQVRTAAWIGDQARGPAALIALACDHLLVSSKAELGGAWKPGISEEALAALEPELFRMGEEELRDPALLRAMLDPDAEINRCRNRLTGQVRWLSPDERSAMNDADDWQILGPAPVANGLSASDAERDGIVRAMVESVGEVDVYYQLEAPPEILTPTRTDAALLSLARTMANPMISVWLMFLGFMLIMTELSQPGLGLPGFLGTLCLILYFWSHYLGGSAEWFEILMFLVGVGFILMELFVIPGVGIFGIAGVLMVIVSIVLAAQTFVIPRNSEELAQLPASLMMVAGAGGGFLGAIFVLRKVLPNAPYFKRLMLEPPVSKPDFSKTAGEALFLPAPGTRGVAVTRLIPAGKARIDGRVVDVITDGVCVESKQKIEVVSVAGNRIEVRSLDG